MKIMKSVDVPARTVSVPWAMQCDICGKQSDQRESWKAGDNEVSEITLTYRTGESWPEGGSGEEIEVDICPECFTTKLIPWLKEQGATLVTKEWIW